MNSFYLINFFIIFCLILLKTESYQHQHQPLLSQPKPTNILRFYQSMKSRNVDELDDHSTSSDRRMSIRWHKNDESDLMRMGQNLENSHKDRFLLHLLKGRYPYAPVNQPVIPEDLYYITDYKTGKVIEPFRPSMFTYFYPFNIPEDWTVYDPIELGVYPPEFPTDGRYSYKGYWYGCPSFVDLQNPVHWLPGPYLFTNICEYNYYY